MTIFNPTFLEKKKFNGETSRVLDNFIPWKILRNVKKYEYEI